MLLRGRAEETSFTQEEFLTLLRALQDESEAGNAVLFQETDVFSDLADKGCRYLQFPGEWDVSSTGMSSVVAWVILAQLWLRRFPLSAGLARDNRVFQFSRYLFSLCNDRENGQNHSSLYVPESVAKAAGLDNGCFRCRDCAVEPCLRHPDLVLWSDNPAVFRRVARYFAEGLERSLSVHRDPAYAVYYWCFDGFGLYPAHRPYHRLRDFLRILCVPSEPDEPAHFDLRCVALSRFAVACREVAREREACEKIRETLNWIANIIEEVMEYKVYAVSPWPYSSFDEMVVQEAAKRLSSGFLFRTYLAAKDLEVPGK